MKHGLQLCTTRRLLLALALSLTNNILWDNVGGPDVRFGAPLAGSCNNSQAEAANSQSIPGSSTNATYFYRVEPAGRCAEYPAGDDGIRGAFSFALTAGQ